MMDAWAGWMDYERTRYSKYTNAERAQYKSSWFLDTIVTGNAANQIPLTRLFSRALVMITYPMLMTTSVFNFDTVMAEETEIYIDARSSCVIPVFGSQCGLLIRGRLRQVDLLIWVCATLTTLLGCRCRCIFCS